MKVVTLAVILFTLASGFSFSGARADDTFGPPGHGGPGHSGPGHPGGFPPPPPAQTRQEFVQCSSPGYATQRCPVQGDVAYAQISNQLSISACEYGKDWGYDREEVWVANGCRANFVVTVDCN